jgi:hypothetical protein
MNGIGIHFAMPVPDWLHLSSACDGKAHPTAHYATYAISFARRSSFKLDTN